MRFRDATHVDLSSFRARRPELGWVYRLAGYAACGCVVFWAADTRRVASVLIVLIIAWLMAWRREVGALWRTSLVAAMAMCAVILTADRLRPPPAPAPAATSDERVYQIDPDGTVRELKP